MYSLAHLIPWIVGMFGLIVGSFLNVVIMREGHQGIGGRSECPHCKKTLSWYELIPVVSFMVQRGRCRSCSVKISWHYPILEILTAVVFFITTRFIMINGFSWVALAFLLVAISFAIAIAGYDLRTRLVPTKWFFGWLLFSILFLLVTPSVFVTQSLWFHINGVIVALPFFLLWLVSHGRWMGFADIEIIAGLSLFHGLVLGISAVLTAFYIGAMVAIVFVIITLVRGKSYASVRKTQIAFAPFLLLVWFGTLVWQWNIFDLFARIWL